MDLERRGTVPCSETKAMISFAVTAPLFWHMQNVGVSHHAARLWLHLNILTCLIVLDCTSQSLPNRVNEVAIFSWVEKMTRKKSKWNHMIGIVNCTMSFRVQ